MEARDKGEGGIHYTVEKASVGVCEDVSPTDAGIPSLLMYLLSVSEDICRLNPWEANNKRYVGGVLFCIKRVGYLVTELTLLNKNNSFTA